MVCNSFYKLLESFFKILLWIFHQHLVYWSIVYFSCSDLIWLHYQGSVSLTNYFKIIPFYSLFRKSLRRVCINSSLYIWQNSPVEPSSFGLYWEISITGLMSLLQFCSNFLFIHDSVWVRYRFQRVCPFLLRHPLHWHLIVQSNHMILYISEVSVVMIPPLLFMILFVSFLFFLDKSSQRFVSFLSFVKNKTKQNKKPLSFIDIFYCVVYFYLSYFLLLILDFICSLSSALRCDLSFLT